MNMKTMAKAVLPLVFALGTSYATAAGYDCDAKRANIEKQIAQAKAHNNSHRVAGLEIALAKISTNCTTEGLVEDAQDRVTKLEKKIAEKQEDIREIEADKQKAQAEGDVKKIAKYDGKIDDKKDDIAELEAELDQARAELSGLKG